MNKPLGVIAFSLGLAAVAWVAYGYLGANPLALTMSLLIGACYLMGALELQRFGRATAALQAALAALPALPALAEPLPKLSDWLATLPPGLQDPVRLRIEGERVALSGPAMTPYLVGLLVLLGMLGTFLGMVVTLNGTVIALQSSSDLPTMRAALAAPILGLGLAFGTSVAGVATSAMLGLMSALSRRDRLQAAQGLEARIATSLRPFSRTFQREATLLSLQSQAALLPELLQGMQALMAQQNQQTEQLGQRLLTGQDQFHQQTRQTYTELAGSVDRSLQHSLAEGARAAGAALQPVVEATMAGITRETALFQQRLADALDQQLTSLAGRLDATVNTLSAGWTEAQSQQDRSAQAISQDLQRTLTQVGSGFNQGTTTLLAAVDSRHAAWLSELQAAAAVLTRQSEDWQDKSAQAQQLQAAALAEQLSASAGGLAQHWRDTLTQQQQDHRQLGDGLQRSLASVSQTFGQQSAALLSALQLSQLAQQASAASNEQQRLAAWTGALEAMAAALHTQWQQSSAESLTRQQQICQTLEHTAGGLQAQAETQARDTIAEMSRLIDAASQAPRAAAELVTQLRQQHSASLAQDNGMLEERSRIMATLASLLDSVNLAATEQRGAIDALVASSSAMLQSAGTQFEQRLSAESARLSDAAEQLGGSAIEVASLGEAFGVAVQLFSHSSEALLGQLKRIEGALVKSSVRSDEQLAYYVAQAREIVDLSISSQRLIVEDLQRLAIRQQPLANQPQPLAGAET